MRWIFPLFLLFVSCSPNSSQEFQREGMTYCQRLILDLEKIENREQLLKAECLLKKHFEGLISLIIEAREFQNKHLDSDIAEAALDERGIDMRLENELRRIYSIEGGREVIERAQHEALVRLDAYEHSLSKKRGLFKS
jgi:hypothetical protein